MRQHAVLCCVWALLRCAPVSAAADLSKNLVTGTHCMDGTPAGYYYAAPSNASTLWVINLKGGGACYDETTCAKRSKGALGSSKGWAATMKGAGLYSDDPAENPDFAGAHHVFVPYCSSDTHKGMNNATSKNTWGFYFMGHLNFKAIVQDLSAKGLTSATQVLLTGGSAGGVGTFFNLDWLSDTLGSGVTVKGAPNAGWFFPGALPADLPHNPYLPPPPYACFAAGRPSPAAACGEDNYKAVDVLWQSYKPPACAAAQAAGEAWHCGSVHELYPFIRQPVFVVENQYDTDQLFAQEGAPRVDNATTRAYIVMYGEAMRNSTEQVLGNAAKKDGLFHPSCLQHGVSTSLTIDSQTWMPVLGDWFFGRGKLSKYYQLVDDCTMVDGLPCNSAPHCQLSGPAPPAPPGPPAPAGGCEKQLTADGCLSAGSKSACESCGEQHRKDLTAAGCTVKGVANLCNGAVAE